ncbi:MAG: hypothetical protein ACYC8T_00600 [Myxococcaceae bacterium]
MRAILLIAALAAPFTPGPTLEPQREPEGAEPGPLTGDPGADEPESSEPGPFRFASALKSTGLVSRARGDELLFPQRVGAQSLWRLRLEPELRPTSSLTATLAYEQRLQLQSAGPELLLLGPLPAAQAPAPYRVTQLDWSLATAPGLFWRHEIDRAQLSIHLERAEVTVGRQAIGWGRGDLFGAVDLFAPFSPVEFDREWRRGVDAVRADVKVGERYSVDLVAAFAETVNGSAFAARARGDLGPADAELVFGRRAEDLFAGATASAPVSGAEVHAELAFFWLPRPWLFGGAFGNDRLVPKAVAGASYYLGVGDGLNLVGEYHYSGFGAPRPEEVLPALLDPEFQSRFLRGDSQILGRHALAALATYTLGMSGSAALQVLVDPSDGSGLVSPSVSLDLGESITVLAGAYFPFGAPPEGATLKSQFGATPLSGLVQLRVYDERPGRGSKGPR